MAAGLAIALSSAAIPAALPSDALPVTINVLAASDLPQALVADVLHEAAAIWREAGVRLAWQRGRTVVPSALRVIIGGGHSAPTADGRLPLGWIAFDNDVHGTSQIYLSFPNAVDLLAGSHVGSTSIAIMPTKERDLLLSRAMGRALAHEIGHYLFGSKQHAADGLMRAVHTAAELFGVERHRFRITPAERAQLAAGRTSIYIAARD